jgi:spermidine synthase
MSARPGRLLTLAAPLFFLSGAAGLVYQVVWSRLLEQVFGVTAYAVTAVLATFLGGLALGGWLLGRLADRSRSPLRLYGLLELGIGAAALAGTFVVRGFEPIHAWAASRLAPDSLALVGVRGLLASIVILPPTILMGATLPVITRALVDRIGRLGRELSLLYALNTLGALVGSVAAGFVLIRAVGVHATLFIAVALNVAVGLAALALAPRISRPPPGEEPAATGPVTPGGARGGWVLVAIGLSGVASLALEVLWTRLLVLIVGTSTYAFVTVLASFLAGIALGSFIASAFVDRLRDPRRAFGWVEVAIAATTVATLPLMGAISIAGHDWVHLLELRPLTLVVGRFGLVFLVMVVPTTLIGMTFPLAARIWARRVEELGGRLGQLYGANALGNIVGAVIGGFVVLPALGLQRGVAAMAAVSLVCAAWALLPVGEDRLRWRPVLRALPVSLGLWTCALLLWHPGPFPGTGGGDADPTRFYREGIVSTVKVFQSGKDARQLMMAVDGVTIGQSGGGVERKQMVLAHLAFVLAGREPATVLTIGLGTGILAGEVAKHPGVARVECIELSPSVIEGARLFSRWNGVALEGGTVHVVNDDGVSWLRRSTSRYDAIISDGKSRSGHAGNAQFYSEDYYAFALEHLTDDGSMIQWIPLDVPPEDLRVIVRTFERVFPHAYLLLGHESAYLVGGARPLALDLDRVQRVLDAPETAGLRRYGWVTAPEVAAVVLADRAGLAAWVAGEDAVNSLEHPILEFYTLGGFGVPDAERVTENLAALVALRREPLRDVAISGAAAPLVAGDAARVDRFLDADVALRRGDPSGTRLVFLAAADAPADGLVRQSAGAALFDAALARDLGGDLAGAARGYDAALAAFPGVAEAWTNLARAHAALGRPADAIADARRALELDPELIVAHTLLRKLLDASGDRAGALVEARAEATLAADVAASHEDLGAELVGTGRPDEALDEFRAAMRLDPRWARPIEQVALLLTLRPGADARREAVDLAKRAVKLSPRDPEAEEVLATAYAASGRIEDAVDAQRDAVEFAAERGDATFLAEARQQLQAYERGRVPSAANGGGAERPF